MRTSRAGPVTSVLGSSLACIGDLNGDGHADILVGAHWANTNGTSAGLVRIYSGADSSIIHDRYGDQASDGLGSLAVGLHDENGDGVPEVAGLIASRHVQPWHMGLNVVRTENSGYDLIGEISIPGVSRSWPALVGYQSHVQFFETAPLLTSSNALRFELAP